MQTFSIYPQQTGTTASSARPTTDYGSVGHCENDGFSIGNSNKNVYSNQYVHTLELKVFTFPFL